jgi:dTDP-L-rhamnose 4-epimerase
VRSVRARDRRDVLHGPRMPGDTPYAGVASIFLSALASGGRPRVFEDGGQWRDFVQVRDVARRMCWPSPSP